MSWWIPYLGREFHVEQWTCWELVRAALAERFDVNVPEYGGIYHDVADVPETVATADAERSNGWIEVPLGSEQPGDVAEFKSSLLWHVGLVIGPGYVLNVSQGYPTAVHEIRVLDRAVAPLAGIWRHPALASASTDSTSA